MKSAREEKKLQTREAILGSAARLLRERGPAGSSVQEVMGGAGLTVGGFYAHFDSKEALFEETLRRSGRETWEKLLSGPEPLLALIRTYLSRSHRDHPETGCPLPATLADVMREGQAGLRHVLSGELSRYVDSVAVHLPEGERSRALALVALLFGGLSLARALGAEDPLSTEMLESCRKLAKEAIDHE